MKSLLLPLLALLLIPVTFGQASLTGIALKNFNEYEEGDTVKIIALSNSHLYGYPEKYIIGSGSDNNYINTNKIKIIHEEIPFWDSIWLWYASEEYYKENELLEHYTKSEKYFREKLGNWIEDEMIMENELMTDYLYRLAFRILTGKLNKGKEYSLRIVVVKSHHSFITSYSSGIIIISDVYLANCKNEKELIHGMSGEIAKILLNENYKTNRSSHEEESIEKKCQELPGLFMNKLYPSMEKTSDTLFHFYIKSALIRKAWNSFHNYQFNESLEILDRMEKFGLLTEDEYVLKSKLYRKLFNTPAKNLEAIVFLEKAIEMSNGNLIDLYLEKALVYSRLENHELAAENLHKYLVGIKKLEDSGYEMNEKKKMAIDLLKMIEKESLRSI